MPKMNLPTEDDVFEKFLKAEDAMKDILYMFYTCAQYGFLFDDMGWEDGKFDPYTYVDCDISTTGYETEFSLLHHGSAIKIICSVLEHIEDSPDRKWEKQTKLIESGRMDHIPELREHLFNIIVTKSKCSADGQVIYKKYVADYFRSLADGI